MGAQFKAVVRQQRSEEHTSELQSQFHLVCRLLLEKKKIHSVPARRSHRRSSARRFCARSIRWPPARRHFLCASRASCRGSSFRRSLFFFFNDTATTEIYTLSLHDALPI